ncbi:MAG: hypothetical protein CSA81_01550 [Acidobacteria bacterium]|nr:MAG: hypothetical protein CSA81_01550 [Acidobacteriota bacterium]
MINFEKIKKTLKGDVFWQLDPEKLDRPNAYLVHVLRFSHMTARKFRRDNLQLHAASLTFNTLLALVPLFTLGFAVLKGLGYRDSFLEKMNEAMTGFPEQVKSTLDLVINAIVHTDFAKLGGIGGLILLFLIIQVLGRIETSINLVWGIETQRSFIRKMTSYISVTVVVPMLIMAAITIKSQFVDNSIPFAVKLLPFLSGLFSLTLLYLTFPNTQVRIKPAFFSGFLTSLLFLVWFKFYALVQPGVTNYNVIYGTIASVPIFLAWLYISWMIVLIGVEFSFAIQNYAAFQQEQEIPDLSLKTSVSLCLTILTRASQALDNQAEPFNLNQFSEEKGIPLRYLFTLTRFLCDQNLLVETSQKNGTFVLIKNPNRIEITPVINAIYQNGATLERIEFPKSVHHAMQTMEKQVSQSLDELKLSDLT